MTPLLSWMLLVTLGLLGGACAIAFARWLEDRDLREWERDMDAWRTMCDELDFPEPGPGGGR